MQQKKLEKLNAILGDRLGWAPLEFAIMGQPQPLYKWVWGPRISIHYSSGKRAVRQTPGGIYYTEPEYEELFLVDERRWIVCKWENPGNPDTWHERFGTDTPYPDKGRYYPTNKWLREGIEPTEDATHYVAKSILEHRKKNYRDHFNELEEREQLRLKKNAATVSEAIDEKLKSFGRPKAWLAGKRGGSISVGGI